MPTESFHHPYKPYDIQLEFMKRLYDTIETKKVGIFESPTGTGKSLSLICASVTWLRDHKRRIVYGECADDDSKASESSAAEPAWVKSQSISLRQTQLEDRLKSFEEELKSIRAIQNDVNGIAKRRKKEPVEPSFELEDYFSKESTTVNAQVASILNNYEVASKDRHLADDVIENPIKIFIASRTHSQLSQFVGQLKLPHFDPSIKSIDDEIVKHISLGSRKQLCINPQVNQAKDVLSINDACKELGANCQFLADGDAMQSFGRRALSDIHDIEELADMGKSLCVCPYYGSRAALPQSEVVTLPYQLLLSKQSRDALGIDIKNCVVIIDEAHNIIDTISSLNSHSVTSVMVSRARKALEIYKTKFFTKMNTGNKINVLKLIKALKSLELLFSDAARGPVENTKPGTEVSQFDILGKTGDLIDFFELQQYLEKSKLAFKVEGYIESEIRKKEEAKNPVGANSKHVPTKSKKSNPVLSQIMGFLLTACNPSSEGKLIWGLVKDSKTLLLQYTLLDPGQEFMSITESARCVILAGGTMEPVEDYTNYLFPYLSPDSIEIFTCGHIVPKRNLIAIPLTRNESTASESIKYVFNYSSRTNAAMMQSLGETILSIAKTVPHGLVIFFPSYQYLEQVQKIWQASGSLWKLLFDCKKIFEEPQDGSSVESVLEQYEEEIKKDASKGAILLSVVGGKLSEGINFSDDLARGVIMIGLPYPNLYSAEIVAKCGFIEKRALQKGSSLAEAKTLAKEYYENLCMRAVNQSIGRAIRHSKDYAAVFLIDERYQHARIQKKLPSWIRGSLTVPDYDLNNVKDFFLSLEGGQ